MAKGITLTPTTTNQPSTRQNPDKISKSFVNSNASDGNDLPQAQPQVFPENETERNLRIRRLFDELDKDKTGFIDKHNIQTSFERLKHLPARNKYALELLEKMSEDDDVVDFDEFKAYVEEKEKELLEVFRQIDKSNDMKLQPEEIEQALAKAGIHCTKRELRKFMEALDRDGNGVIDFNEWRDFLLLLPRETTLREIYTYYQAFAKLNMDGDVIITATDPRYILAGAMAGTVSRTATAPFDRLKVYLQTQYHTLPSRSRAHSAVLESAKNLFRSGGILNFFCGNGLNVAKIAPESAIKFFSYERIKAGVATMLGKKDKESIGMSGRFLSGGLAGIISQFSIYPLETLKTRIMSSAGVSSASASPNESVLLTTAQGMWNKQGIRAFYKGIVPALVGVFPYAAIDMSVYETLKMGYVKWQYGELQDPLKPSRPASAFVSLGCGMTSGSIGAIMVYPLALVRTRLQAQGTVGHPQTYTSTTDVIRKTYAAEGIRGFYKGLVPTLTKVVPSAAITYLVYDKSKTIFHLK